MMKKGIYIPCLWVILAACSPADQNQRQFLHDITSGPTPWTTDQFEPGERDFSFAIISDLSGGEREGVFSLAVEQVNRLEPDFVLCVGDLIDGGTKDRAQLNREWEDFDQRASILTMPFFHLGGNHDLTNDVMREVWRERYGPRYYHFAYDSVLFLMIDSEDFGEDRMEEIYQARAEAIKELEKEDGDITQTAYWGMSERSTGAMGDDQLAYFKQVLDNYPNAKWTFLLMHKPLWLREDERGLGRLEEALRNRPYTVINGHYHTFSHQERNGRDYMMLGTTGGSQPQGNPNSFDHLTWIRMTEEGPDISLIKMEGILDKKGNNNWPEDVP